MRLDRVGDNRIEFVVYNSDYEAEVLRWSDAIRAVRFASPEAEGKAQLRFGGPSRNKQNKALWVQLQLTLPGWAVRKR